MENFSRILRNISLWWGDLHYSHALKRYLFILAAGVIAISAFLIFRAPSDSAADIPLDIKVVNTPITLTIDIEGAVNRPGVYTLSSGSRVIDAIKAAGGLAKNSDPSDVNQARVVNDGEQIYIYAKVAAKGTLKRAPVKVKPAGFVSINQAGAKEFEALDGIGPVLAQRIVTYRKSNGAFTSIEDLLKVPGIGNATLAKFKSKLRV